MRMDVVVKLIIQKYGYPHLDGRQVGELMGVSQQTVSRWTRSSEDLRIGKLLKNRINELIDIEDVDKASEQKEDSA
jgi:transcriptional regulator with XRE-family HTH domain